MADTSKHAEVEKQLMKSKICQMSNCAHPWSWLSINSGLPLLDWKHLCFVTGIQRHGCPFRSGLFVEVRILELPKHALSFPVRHGCCKMFIQMHDLLALSKPLLPLACVATMSCKGCLRVQQVAAGLIKGTSVDICSPEIALASLWFLD